MGIVQLVDINGEITSQERRNPIVEESLDSGVPGMVGRHVEEIRKYAMETGAMMIFRPTNPVMVATYHLYEKYKMSKLIGKPGPVVGIHAKSANPARFDKGLWEIGALVPVDQRLSKAFDQENQNEVDKFNSGQSPEIKLKKVYLKDRNGYKIYVIEQANKQLLKSSGKIQAVIKDNQGRLHYYNEKGKYDSTTFFRLNANDTAKPIEVFASEKGELLVADYDPLVIAHPFAENGKTYTFTESGTEVRPLAQSESIPVLNHSNSKGIIGSKDYSLIEDLRLRTGNFVQHGAANFFPTGSTIERNCIVFRPNGEIALLQNGADVLEELNTARVGGYSNCKSVIGGGKLKCNARPNPLWGFFPEIINAGNAIEIKTKLVNYSNSESNPKPTIAKKFATINWDGVEEFCNSPRRKPPEKEIFYLLFELCVAITHIDEDRRYSEVINKSRELFKAGVENCSAVKDLLPYIDEFASMEPSSSLGATSASGAADKAPHSPPSGAKRK